MAGLLQQGMQPAPQQAPPQGQAPQGAPMQSEPQQQPPQQPPQGEQPTQAGDDPRVNAGPDEAGPQFEALLEGMLGYLYGDGMEQALQMIQQGEDVTERMGLVIGTVMVTIHNMLTQEGKTVPPNVMVRAGIELAKAVGEMAMQAGRLQEGEDEAIEAAFMLGLGKLGQNADDITSEQKQKYGQIVGALREGKQQAMGGQPQQSQQGQQPPMQGGMQ